MVIDMYKIYISSIQGRSSLNISVHPIIFLDSQIVQIDVDLSDDLLLVSNFTKCILCNTITEEYKQVRRVVAIECKSK